jgi:hypothetical protein
MVLADFVVGQGQRVGQILEPALWLVGALLLAALVLKLLQRARRQQAAKTGDATHDQLAHFRTLYENGQMSPEEYGRVYALLSGQIQEKAKPPSPGPGSPPGPPRTEPTPEDREGQEGH